MKTAPLRSADMTTEEEQWRDIPSWEGLYQASSYGRIRSLIRRGRYRNYGGKILIGGVDDDGYRNVTLYKPGEKRRNPHVSVLVCTTFHGPKPLPGLGSQAAHRDGVKTNDRADNLRWATAIENDHDKDVHGTRALGTKHGCAKINEETARNIYASKGPAAKIGMQYGINASTVLRIRSRRLWASATATLQPSEKQT